jgi:GNAT superfamily N-acetyltransferase
VARGFVDQHVEDRWVLDLPWHGSAERSAAPVGYRIRSWAGACPDDLVQAYAGLRSAMARDVPTGGLTYEPPSWDVARVRGNEERTADRYLAVVSLARARDGSPAGYTLVYLDRGDPDHVRQDDTLVLTGHRGRGVGTALKTANLREPDEHRDSRRLLHTWTARSNTAMRAVNTRLGFRAVESVHEYERTDP